LARANAVAPAVALTVRHSSSRPFLNIIFTCLRRVQLGEGKGRQIQGFLPRYAPPRIGFFSSSFCCGLTGRVYMQDTRYTRQRNQPSTTENQTRCGGPRPRRTAMVRWTTQRAVGLK
jgi:hypothetical protein